MQNLVIGYAYKLYHRHQKLSRSTKHLKLFMRKIHIKLGFKKI